MSATVRPRPHARQLTLPVVMWLACAAVFPARAQDAAATPAAAAQDPTVVITRTVHPRVAYRGVPRTDNPVHAEATTFPGQVFHGTLQQVMDRVVGDGDLGQRGSVGVSVGAIVPTLDRAMAPLIDSSMLGPSSRGTSSIGPSASAGRAVGGALSGATRDLAPRITGGVMQALSPSVQGGGP